MKMMVLKNCTPNPNYVVTQTEMHSACPRKKVSYSLILTTHCYRINERNYKGKNKLLAMLSNTAQKGRGQNKAMLSHGLDTMSFSYCFPLSVSQPFSKNNQQSQ